MLSSTANDGSRPPLEFTHPLRVLPWVRNLPDKRWINALLTVALCIVTAIPFALIPEYPKTLGELWVHYGTSLVYSLAIGTCIHSLSQLCVPKIRVWFAHRPFALRLLADVVVWICGALLGFLIGATILNHDFQRTAYVFFDVIAVAIVLSVVTGLIMRRQAVHELRVAREQAERSEAQHALAMSRLRLLQAQIEPHFLFNTLANVSSLIEVEPKQARRMLDQFTLLLRASLDQTRQATTTLRAELQTVEAYLSILKIRMGERLSYEVIASPELLGIQIPAMLLQPIVENAVKHGIEPQLRGGAVRIEVRRDAAQLVFAVADNGVGFVPNNKENVGLGAVRERLAVQFGANASLQIERTADNWTRVSIRIPMPA